MSFHLKEDYERLLVGLVSTDNGFWFRVGQHLEESYLRLSSSRLMLKAVRSILQDTPRAVLSEMVVLQRLYTMNGEGEVGHADLLSVEDHFAFLSATEHDPESVLAEIIPTLRREKTGEIARKIVAAYGANTPPYDLARELLALETLGQVAVDVTSEGVDIDLDNLSVLDGMSGSLLLPTGIMELDMALGGGLPFAELTTVHGDSGSGKSFFLCHLAAVAALHGFDVGYFAAEGKQPDLFARIAAALTGLPIRDLGPGGIGMEMAREILKRQREEGRIGKIVLGCFPPKTVPVSGVRKWFSSREEKLKRRIKVRLVDYGDLILSDEAKDRGDDYRTAQNVWAGLSGMATEGASEEGGGNLVVTATQSKRPDFSKPGEPLPILRGAKVADSYHKFRLSGVFISFTPQPDKGASAGYSYVIDKHRHLGEDGEPIGPIPHFRHMARMADLGHL